MINSSVWYRHWLEIRSGLMVAAICAGVSCSLFPVFVLDQFPSSEASSAHALIITAVAMFVGIFLAGTGLRTNGFQIGHPSFHYTLSLPVSRFDLIWTRFAAACAAVFGLLMAMLLFDCAALPIMRRAVPLGAMAVSSLLAGLIAMSMMAVFGVLIPLVAEKVAGLVFAVAIYAGFYFAGRTAKNFVGSQDVAWSHAGELLLVVGVGLPAAMVAKRRDF